MAVEARYVLASIRAALGLCKLSILFMHTGRTLELSRHQLELPCRERPACIRPSVCARMEQTFACAQAGRGGSAL
eukprot:1154169-Pelagomonas_calceolata.AAC.3